LPETITTEGDALRRSTALQVLVAGANLWFVAAGFPWLFIEQPTLLQSVLHAVPLAMLLLGAGILGWNHGSVRLRANTRQALVIAIPLSVGVATAVRGEEINRLALPGGALLLCVASLWVFVGVLGTDGFVRPLPPVATPHPPMVERVRPAANLTQWVVVVAAAATVTLAPRWATPAERGGATDDAVVAGSLLTTTAAIAIAIGMLLIMLGPAATTTSTTLRTSLRQRLIPALLMATIGGATYWMVASQTLVHVPLFGR